MPELPSGWPCCPRSQQDCKEAASRESHPDWSPAMSLQCCQQLFARAPAAGGRQQQQCGPPQQRWARLQCSAAIQQCPVDRRAAVSAMLLLPLLLQPTARAEEEEPSTAAPSIEVGG